MKKILISGLVLSAVGCGKKSDSSSATDDSATTLEEAIESTLASAYPGSLALSVFPEQSGSGLRLADEEVAPETLKEKAAEAEKYLTGKAENCLPPVFLRQLKEQTETCYDFDQEMIVGTRQSQSYGTADGKSKLTGSTEACLVSFARTQIKEVENLIDMGMGLQQGMIC